MWGNHSKTLDSLPSDVLVNNVSERCRLENKKVKGPKVIRKGEAFLLLIQSTFECKCCGMAEGFGKKPERGATHCYRFATINIVEAGEIHLIDFASWTFR